MQEFYAMDKVASKNAKRKDGSEKKVVMNGSAKPNNAKHNNAKGTVYI